MASKEEWRDYARKIEARHLKLVNTLTGIAANDSYTRPRKMPAHEHLRKLANDALERDTKIAQAEIDARQRNES